MCTAVSLYENGHYFGRNLDVERSYNESFIITPREFTLSYRREAVQHKHYALWGTGIIINNYPLYFDACNEYGLCMAGLKFPEDAIYCDFKADMYNITPFELIPFVLSQCKTVGQARSLLEKTNAVNINFSDELPLSPLHWIISDKGESVTVEPLKDGLIIYDNPVGVLTNSPQFNVQMFNLNNYMHLSPQQPENLFCKNVTLNCYSLGMGGLGLPGDLSSMSRFVRCAFTKLNIKSSETPLNDFFNTLYCVYQPYGLNDTGGGVYEYTRYSCCYNSDIYYYTTYGNKSVCSINVIKENLDSGTLMTYPHKTKMHIDMQN